MYAYDHALSRKRLAEAGFPNGFSLDVVAYREVSQPEAIITYMQAVSIKARLTTMQYAAMR